MDLARDPRWGRVEETYGEDPYLTGVMGSRYVRGIQKNHRVASTLKHYVAHGTPESGVNLSPVNAGERQVRELYLPPFAEAMKEKPLSVMPAYSEIDGIPCSCSSHVLTEILREELGFDGYTISDYMAVEMLHNFHHTAETPAEAGRQALEAGMDLEAPNEYGFGQKMLELVQKGEISMEALDRAVERILSVKARLGLFEENVPESVRRVDMEAHRKLALKAAEESIVLLKNENHILPLKETVKNIAVIGPNAAIAQLGDYCSAGGTGVSLLEGLKELYSGTLHYVQGSTLYQKIPGGIREAVEAAEKSDVVLLALGGSGSTYGGIGWGEDGCGEVTSGEGFDSVDIRLSVPQLELAEHVLDTGKPVILILEDGRPCAIPEIYDRAGAVIQAWYPGQEGGRALAEILFGKVNPSGKLTVSIPKHVGQIPVCYNRKPSTGGFYHRPGTPEKPGRDYTTMDTKPYYSFGYGLSYTRFAYSNLEIQEQKNGAVVRVDVQNVGEVPGKEVVQLYINDEVSSVTTPVKALKGFCKVDLEPGQKRTVTFTLDAQSLYLIDRDMKKRVEAGWFEVFVGDQKGRFYVQGVEL